MEMLISLRGDKHEFCLVVIKFKHELFRGIALKNHAFLVSAPLLHTTLNVDVGKAI